MADAMRRRGWYAVVSSETITFRKSLEPVAAVRRRVAAAGSRRQGALPGAPRRRRRRGLRPRHHPGADAASARAARCRTRSCSQRSAAPRGCRTSSSGCTTGPRHPLCLRPVPRRRASGASQRLASSRHTARGRVAEERPAARALPARRGCGFVPVSAPAAPARRAPEGVITWIPPSDLDHHRSHRRRAHRRRRRASSCADRTEQREQRRAREGREAARRGAGVRPRRPRGRGASRAGEGGCRNRRRRGAAGAGARRAGGCRRPPPRRQRRRARGRGRRSIAPSRRRRCARRTTSTPT